MNCVIYRSSRKADTYLFVPEKDKFDAIPASLLKTLGKLEWAMDLELSPEKPLAQAKATDVIQSIQKQGFYLQLPRI